MNDCVSLGIKPVPDDVRKIEYAITTSMVEYGYDHTKPPIIQDYSLTINKGNVCAILGPNGRGKTTFLKLLLGILKPRAGSIEVNGKIAFVPQLFHVSFPYRVLDMVLMGLARKIGLFSLPSHKDEAIALEALTRLGLAHLAEHNFDELSGGQRQLIIFARALASGADILVLDEPTSALDLKNQGIVLEWINHLAREEGLTVIFTTHHPHHAHAIADQSLLMFSDENYAYGSIDEVLTEENLHRLYGVEMRRVDFEHQGEHLEILVPIYTGLRQLTGGR